MEESPFVSDTLDMVLDMHERHGNTGAVVQAYLTAAPVSIDPYVVAFGHETIFEGSQIEGALSRRLRQTQGAGRKDLLGFDALHKALAKKTSRDRGCRARADSRQAL